MHKHNQNLPIQCVKKRHGFMAVITEHKKILIKNKRPFYGNTVKGPIVLILAAGVYLSCQSSNAFFAKRSIFNYFKTQNNISLSSTP